MSKRFSMAVIFLAFACVARPSLLVYDGFDYDLGDLNGANGGTGWAGAYTGHQDVNVLSGGLSYSAGNVIVDGGIRTAAIQGTAGIPADQVTIPLNRGFSTITSDDVFFSFLFRPTADIPSFAAKDRDFLYFYISDDNDIRNSFGIGQLISVESTNTLKPLGARLTDGSEVATTVNSTIPTAVSTFLLVGHLYKNASANYNQLDFYVNPTSTTFGDDSIAAQVSRDIGIGGGLDTFGLRYGFPESNNDYRFDELRIGTTWEAVVIPEPGTLTLLGLSLTALALVRPRKEPKKSQQGC